jgi:hypothetical protein
MTPRQESLYWRSWAAACRKVGCPASDNVGRHAIHEAALGYDKSHKEFTNAELDKVLARLRLVVDPDDIEARLTIDDPERRPRRRLEYAIKRFPEALVRKICLDAFKVANWADLDFQQLGFLVKRLKRIQYRWQHKAPEAAQQTA